MNDLSNPLETPSVADRLISLITEMSGEQQKTLLAAVEEWLPRERRRRPRKPVYAFVDFVVNGRGYKEFARDISEGGIFIETSASFPVGKEIIMAITFPDSSTPLKVAGRIIRADERGIGVQFYVNSMLEILSIRSLLKEI